MTLPQFDLHRAGSIEEITELSERFGDDAVLHCGGTELVLVMKLGFAPYRHVIDVKGADELRGIVAGEDLVIGANTTHRAIETHPEILARWSGLADMTSSVGNRRVRSVGTIGGNLCFADPHSDPMTTLVAADATVECRRGREESRRMPVSEFVKGPYESVLQQGEVLARIRVPPLPDGAVLLHRKIRFHERAIATVAMIARTTDNRLDEVRVAVGAVGNRAVLIPDATQLLDGAPADALEPGLIDDLADAAVECGEPVTDAYGSADYKSHLLRVLVQRTVAEMTVALSGASS